MASVLARRILFLPSWAAAVRRPLFVGAALGAQPKPQVDPIQELFLEKLKEFKAKSKGGKIPDLDSLTEKQHADDLERLKRIYGGGDLSKFPKFSFEEK